MMMMLMMGVDDGVDDGGRMMLTLGTSLVTALWLIRIKYRHS